MTTTNTVGDHFVYFDGTRRSPKYDAFVKKELTMLLHRVKSKHKVYLAEWINNFG